MKRFLVKRGTRDRVRASGGVEALVEALLVPILNLLTKPGLANSSCSPVKLARRLI